MNHTDYFLQALCPLLFAYFLFVHFNSHIRTDPSAEGAGRAFTPILENNEVISLIVELLRQAEALFRTGHDTELASFAAFLVNRNLSHFLSYF